MTTTALSHILTLQPLIYALIAGAGAFGVISTIHTMMLSPDYERPIYYRRIAYIGIAIAIGFCLPSIVEWAQGYMM